MSETRPWVDAFANEMEAKLAANRHKGDRTGWQREDVAWLFGNLEREVDELRRALGIMCRACSAQGEVATAAAIRSECADVANFAMMIADVAGKMRPKGVVR